MLKKFVRRNLLILGLFIALFIIIMQLAKQPEISLAPLYKVPSAIKVHFNPEEKLYVVNFFASWCKACIEEHKNIVSLKKKTKVSIYGIAVNDNEYALDYMLQKHHNPYKKFSTHFPLMEVPELEISRIPRTLIVYEGDIIYDHSGEINKSILDKKILPIIKRILDKKSMKAKEPRT